MSRKAIAAELQGILEQLQYLAIQGESLAASSALISPSYFKAIQTAVSMSAGDLDQKGLLERKRPASEPAPAKEPA